MWDLVAKVAFGELLDPYYSMSIDNGSIGHAEISLGILRTACVE